MIAELQLKEYLENATESSRRIRTILTILVVVTVLIFAGFLNSWQGYAWNRERIRFRQDYIREVNVRIDQLKKASQQPTSSPNDVPDLDANLTPLLQKLPPSYGSKECEKKLNNGASREEAINDRIICYEGVKGLSDEFLKDSVRAYVENAYLIRVPFFGVAFDINDLGLIGSLSLIVILIMLRLNLRNFIVSLRIGFKAAGKANLHEDFYDILASRQLFAFPPLEDPNQHPHKGRTEKIWGQSEVKAYYDFVLKVFSWSFFIIKRALWLMFELLLASSYEETYSKQKQNDRAQNGWHSNPHPLLAFVPIWICIVPALVQAAVVINDFQSYDVGLVVNGLRTKTSFVFSLICLVIILGLGCWCVSKCLEIDELWKSFSGLMIADAEMSKAPRASFQSEIYSTDGEDNGSKSVPPVHTPT